MMHNLSSYLDEIYLAEEFFSIYLYQKIYRNFSFKEILIFNDTIDHYYNLIEERNNFIFQVFFNYFEK